MKKSYEMDMCNGPLFGKILLFSIPLILSGVLQLLFNAADIVVVGRFAGSTALAAVGSTSSLINLLTNLFIGFSVGANVLVAQFYGAKREKDVSETVHSAILLSVISGILLLVIGLTTTRQILVWMGTPNDVLEQAALYLKIYFLGMPSMLLYNFGSSILRAVGDTRRPLYYLSFAGVINVILNLIFVIVFHMGVAGVAIATIVSQTVSAILICRLLMRMDSCCRLEKEKLRLTANKTLQIMRIGFPAGLQGMVFSLSNVLIQSSVNSFGSVAMAGNTAAMNIEGFIYVAMNTFQQTSMSFISQNFGAGKQERIRKVLLMCLGMVTVVGVVFGVSAYFAGEPLLSIYSSDAEVIKYGLSRMAIICTMYCLCGIMDTMVGALRGIGYAFIPMIVSLMGACGLRIIWIFTVFRWQHSLESLYISYPISWTITGLVHMLCYVIIRRKQLRRLESC
ncbi:MAG: MATE family efflux transporter [Lachnospiraceae bacterium]|nr:MATE family efflux transporter [Lachnospiraceae bacterium]